MSSMKSIVIKNVEELKRYRATIVENLSTGVEMIKELLDTNDPLSFFKTIKFEKSITDPLTGEPENFIEVVNQSQTYLVTLMGAEYLLLKHPDTVFKVNLGNVSGYDIESVDGKIIADCFAATSYRSNRKLTKDLKRLAENECAEHRYEFFYDTEFTEEHNLYYKKAYPQIEIIKFSEIA